MYSDMYAHTHGIVYIEWVSIMPLAKPVLFSKVSPLTAVAQSDFHRFASTSTAPTLPITLALLNPSPSLPSDFYWSNYSGTFQKYINFEPLGSPFLAGLAPFPHCTHCKRKDPYCAQYSLLRSAAGSGDCVHQRVQDTMMCTVIWEWWDSHTVRNTTVTQLRFYISLETFLCRLLVFIETCHSLHCPDGQWCLMLVNAHGCVMGVCTPRSHPDSGFCSQSLWDRYLSLVSLLFWYEKLNNLHQKWLK